MNIKEIIIWITIGFFINNCWTYRRPFLMPEWMTKTIATTGIGIRVNMNGVNFKCYKDNE